MDEKKLLKSVKKNALICGMLALLVITIGAMLAVVGAAQLGMLERLTDDRYLSNPDIKYSDLDNATYQYTTDDIEYMAISVSYILFAGAAMIGVGYGAILVVGAIVPSRKDRHETYCHVDTTGDEYCSNCGIELSKLTKK